MAECPHCKEYVSYLSYIINADNGWRNILRFDKVYTCDKCNQDFFINLRSTVKRSVFQLIIFIFVFVSYSLLSEYYKIDIFVFIFSGILLLQINEYIWWRKFAKLDQAEE